MDFVIKDDALTFVRSLEWLKDKRLCGTNCSEWKSRFFFGKTEQLLVQRNFFYHRQYKTLIIVGVFTDEIHTTWRTNTQRCILAEFSGERLQSFGSNVINLHGFFGHN